MLTKTGSGNGLNCKFSLPGLIQNIFCGTRKRYDLLATPDSRHASTIELHISAPERPNPERYTEYDEPFASLDITRFFRRYRTTVALTTIVSLLGAGLYIVTATPVFTATARLLLEPKTQNVFNPATKENFITLDTPHVESQLAILSSERIASIVVRRLGDRLKTANQRVGIWTYLSKILNSNFESYLSKTWNSNFDSNRVQKTKLELLIADVQKKIDVERVGLSFAIDISFSASDPEIAASVANAVVDAYVEDQVDAKIAAARRSSEWLERRIIGLGKDINATSLALKGLKAKRDYRIGSRKHARAPTDGVKTDGQLTDSAAAGNSMTMEELELRYETYRKLYENYLAAYWQSLQKGTSPFSAARSITRATAPLNSSHPRSFLILAFALAAGLLAGLGLAFARYDLKIAR